VLKKSAGLWINNLKKIDFYVRFHASTNMSKQNLTELKCKPCEGGVHTLPIPEENMYLKEVDEWYIDREEEHKISKEFVLDDFKEAIDFVNRVGELAEKEGHHPNIHIYYNEVELVLYTHAIGGLSENDFIMAAKIDELFQDYEEE